jgi:hypothetical protein
VTAWHVDPGCGFRPIWQAALGDGNQATPVVLGNVLFATGGKPGGFYVLNAANGTKLWSFPTPGRTVAGMTSAAGSSSAPTRRAWCTRSRTPRVVGRACTLSCFRG